ncbi:MAG: lipocalin-like domain-containing protein [Janthinobacterium lividum]
MQLAVCALALAGNTAFCAAPLPEPVLPNQALEFPRDFGAHPGFRSEWWYATGWLTKADGKPLGFQITFFRSATEHDAGNPSAFAPKQLIIAHAAISDPASGKLLHAQKSARAGFGLAQAASGDTDVTLDDWHFKRDPDGHYDASLVASDFTLQLRLTPTQPLLLQGERGFSRKGPKAGQASYYYSEPQLQVSGSVTQNATGKAAQAVTGSAWLDHEWSSNYLDTDAAGWDWTGINLDDGSALMAFQIRGKSGAKLWSHAVLRDSAGKTRDFDGSQVTFSTQRQWRSPHTDAVYPVATTIQTGAIRWSLTPLMDDQELDSRLSTGAVYWEGAVKVARDGKPAGQGYLELTGYVKPLKL